MIKPFSSALLKSKISNLLNQQKRIAIQFSSNDKHKRKQIKESLNKIDKELIDKFTSFVENNLMEDKINTIVIASKLSMSYSSLYRKIKAITGMSINDFIRKIRITKAEQLLLSGKYNISEKANMVGFNSLSHFRKVFKEELGLLPSDYIKEIKE